MYNFSKDFDEGAGEKDHICKKGARPKFKIEFNRFFSLSGRGAKEKKTADG